MELINFTNAKHVAKTYNGANGSKKCIIYENTPYMIKFAPHASRNKNLIYRNSVFSEHISCQIIKSIGLEVQETMLGRYKDKIVVACKDFCNEGWILNDFMGLRNADDNSEVKASNLELSYILKSIDRQSLFDIPSTELRQFFWRQFVVDTLLGNFDRHNGNWGILHNFMFNTSKIAPIYDCGSCLFPEADEAIMNEVLQNNQALRFRIYELPKSALKIDGININPYEFLLNTDNEDALGALEAIVSKIDINRISKIIEKTPVISNLQKEFCFKIVSSRFELILKHCLEYNPNISSRRMPLEQEIKNNELNSTGIKIV